MPGLEISINCLCLFVDDPRGGADGKGVMHVLMPDTNGAHQHRVNVLFDGSGPNGKPMEGLSLRLGGPGRTADLSFRAQKAPTNGEEVVDLNVLSDEKVDPALVDTIDHPKVVSRITLFDGKIKSLRAEATWHFAKLGPDARIAMANEVVWEIPDIADDNLEWKPTRRGGDSPPFRSLAELGGGGGTRHLGVYNVTPDSFPPKPGGILNPVEIKHHFEVFYGLYGVQPTPEQLPDDPKRIGGHTAFVDQFRRAYDDPEAVDRLVGIVERLAEAAESGSSLDFDRIFESDTFNCPTGGGHMP